MANRFFEYDGKKIYYKNKQDAIARIRKFGFSVRQSGEIFNKLNTKTFEVFILSDDGEVLKINLADPFKEVLRTKFDVQRIPNKKMLHADEDEIKDFRVMQHIPGKETITVIVKFYCIIDFGSDLFIDKLKFLTEESIRKILNTDTRDYRRLYNILFDNQVLFKGRGGEEDFNPDIDGHRILMRGDLARFVYKMIKEKKIEILDIDKREREEYENAIGDRDGIEDDDGNKKYMRTYETVVTARAERIEEIAVSRFFQWLNGFPTDATAQLWWFKEVSRYDETFIKLSDFYMGEKEYNLTQWSNINYLGDRLKNDDSCVVKFISSKYKNLYWDIKKLENPKHGNKISLKNFDIFCKGNDIYYSLKDIGGKTISEYTDGLSKFNKNQIMNAIYYNKHIYPFSGGNLIKAAVEPRENIRVKNCGDKFIEFYNMGIIPRGVKIMREFGGKDIKIMSFVKGGKRYYENNERDKFVKVLKKMNIGITDKKIPYDINLINLLDFILKIKKSKCNILSFLPLKRPFKAQALHWQAPEKKYSNNKLKKLIKEKMIKGIDHNKAYAWALYDLPYLIVHDWRKHNVRNVVSKRIEITEHYLYFVQVSEFTSLLPQSGMYPGYHLQICIKNNVKFDIIEEYQTETRINFYSDAIMALYKNMDYDNYSDFKQLMVILIGKFEREMTESVEYNFKEVCSKLESKKISGFKQKIKDKDNVIIYDTKTKVKHVRDCIPVNIQIKCKMYEKCTKKINELIGNGCKIIQIQTDAIYFIGEYPSDVKDIPNEQLGKMWGGWKKKDDFRNQPSWRYQRENIYVRECTEVKELMPTEDVLTGCEALMETKQKFCGTLDYTNPNHNGGNKLYMKYAGNGKTYKIINEYVMEFIKNDKCNDYVIYTPTHSTLNDYKKINIVKKVDEKEDYDEGIEYNIKCDIIQRLCYDNSIPDEKTVIIDEIGFIGADGHDFLYKLNAYGKRIICFGDFNQLMPIGENRPYNQPHYLKWLFGESIDIKFENYRNNFTKKYYDFLINPHTESEYLRAEVTKHSTSNMIDAEIVICYKNETRRKINKTIMRKKGIKPYSVGCKMMCVHNKFSNYGLWNHKELEIIKVENDIYTLQDNESMKYFIEKKKIQNEKYFRFAYCINAHESQGKTYKSYYWANEDDFVFSHKDYINTPGRFAYTIISRLEQKKDIKK